MLRTFSTTLSLSFLLTSSLYAMTEDDAGELLQRGKPIQLLKGSGNTLEAVLGAGNNVLLKMSMDLNLSKSPVDKEQLEVPIRLFLTDFASSPTSHPAVDLNVKVDWKSAPLTCVLPDKPQTFDGYSQFTDWLSQGYFINKIMIAYDFHIDVKKSAPSLAEHLFSLPTNGYLFHGTHTIEGGSIKPDRSVPQVTYNSQRGGVNNTTATLKGTFYIKDKPYPIDEHQQVFPHPIIEQHEVKRDQTKKLYHHNWLAQSEITTLETYEEFPRSQTNNWANAPSETYSLLRQRPGDLKEITHIACSDGTTGDSIDISDGKIFLLNAEGINGKDSTHVESIVTDKKGKPFIMRYLYAETSKEESLKSLEEKAKRAAIATVEEREKAKVEKAKAKEAVKQNIEDLKRKLENTQSKVDEVKEHLVKVREEEEEHKRSKDYFILGEKYYNSQGVAQDYTKALKFYYKAAEQGNVRAKYRIGYFFQYGHGGVVQDYVKAIEWYQKAAEQNHVDAQYKLGNLYSAGNHGVRRDYVKAIEWHEKAAAQNYFPSKDWLFRLSKSDEQYKVGDSYHNIYRNYAKAMEWYLKAAEQNHAGAQFGIGCLYNNGQGVTKDYGKAIEWYEKAAAQNHVEAQYNLGVLYSSEGVTQDYKKASEWYEKAAAQNHVEAQDNIGVLYHNGQGVTQDYKKAMEWYQKAAAQNYVWAQYHIGRLYEQSQGVFRNPKVAMEWYQKAAEQNHTGAQFSLGKLYTEEGSTQDFKKAMEWYQKAAAQNHAEAQCMVARSYEHGSCSLLKDDKKAKEWYQRAAALGNKDARAALEKLEKK